MSGWDYCLYLVKISWPAVCGLILIYLFFGIRLFQSLRGLVKDNCRYHFFSAASLRIAVSLVVICIYSVMFFQGNRDWFLPPSEFRGTIEDLQEIKISEISRYDVTLHKGEDFITVYVDSSTFQSLHKADYVQITCLPVRKDVIQCIVLTQQATDVI